MSSFERPTAKSNYFAKAPYVTNFLDRRGETESLDVLPGQHHHRTARPGENSRTKHRRTFTKLRSRRFTNVVFGLSRTVRRRIQSKIGRAFGHDRCVGLQTWVAEFRTASTTINNRNELVAEVAAKIEKDLILLGATGIEDRLQDVSKRLDFHS